MNMMEIMWLVHHTERMELHTLFTLVCLGGLGVTAGVICCVYGWSCVKRFVRKVGGGTKLGSLVAILMLAGSVIYGGVGHGWDFKFFEDSGIWDTGSFYDLETRTAVAVWGYLPAVEGFNMKWYCDIKYDDGEEGKIMLPDVPVVAGMASYTFEGLKDKPLKSMTIFCYTQYVHPVQVVTNGVYHIDGIMRTLATTNSPSPSFVTPSIRILVNMETGETEVLTPTDDYEDSLLVRLADECGLDETETDEEEEEE